MGDRLTIGDNLDTLDIRSKQPKIDQLIKGVPLVFIPTAGGTGFVVFRSKGVMEQGNSNPSLSIIINEFAEPEANLTLQGLRRLPSATINSYTQLIDGPIDFSCYRLFGWIEDNPNLQESNPTPTPQQDP